MKVAGEDEQSTARWYNWIAVFFVSVALVLISGNAGLIVERVTNCLIEAVSTQTQKHEHAVTLTSRPFAGNPSLLYQPIHALRGRIRPLQDCAYPDLFQRLPTGGG